MADLRELALKINKECASLMMGPVEIDRMVEILSAALAEAPEAEQGWQPIATAPKDRNIILTDGEKISEGGWLSQVEQGAEYEGQMGAPSAGWWSVSCIEDPTHWMPLPDAPKYVNESRHE